MSYVELPEEQSFDKTYPSWIIAYCLDTDSFFCTNQRWFFWQYDDEFRCENDAINYFKNHIEKFRQVRYKIATECGGIRKDGCVFLENTKEKF